MSKAATHMQLSWRRMLALCIKTFLRGMVAVIPLILTLTIVWWLVYSAELLFGRAIKLILPEQLYTPGIGIFTAVIATFLIGLFVNSVRLARIFGRLEQLLGQIPLIKTIYGSIKDIFQFFSSDREKFSGVVLVDLNESTGQLLGFTTTDQPQETLGAPVIDQVAVYLPMSYQIGGYTVLISRDRITPVKISVEDALRFVLTAGVSGNSSSANKSKTNESSFDSKH